MWSHIAFAAEAALDFFLSYIISPPLKLMKYNKTITLFYTVGMNLLVVHSLSFKAASMLILKPFSG